MARARSCKRGGVARKKNAEKKVFFLVKCTRIRVGTDQALGVNSELNILTPGSEIMIFYPIPYIYLPYTLHLYTLYRQPEDLSIRCALKLTTDALKP
jgi:hypothetical protein